MRRLLLVVSLLLMVSPAAAAQGRSVEFRQGDAFRGPVKSVRIEYATFGRVEGRLVEGARRLASTVTYAPDGRRREQEAYAPDGSLRARSVSLYDEAGNEVEAAAFDGAGKLQSKRVYRPDTGETFVYGGDGALRERRVVVRRADGTLAETQVYDGGGALKERSVNEREGKTSVWRTYGRDGSLRQQDTHSLDYGGPHRTESQTYAADGAVVGRRVSVADAGVSDLRKAEEKADGGPPRVTRETREYDARRNLSKLTTYKWDAEAGGYEPSGVSYYTIEYYR